MRGAFAAANAALASFVAAFPDSTAPDTSITGGANGLVQSNAATFIFTGTDDRTAPDSLTFEYFVDGA